jgi:hypothetical protein
MISRELLKEEINNIKKDEYLEVVYRIIKSLGVRQENGSQKLSGEPAKFGEKSDWHEFIRKTYACLADSQIQRWDQGVCEVREEIE